MCEKCQDRGWVKFSGEFGHFCGCAAGKELEKRITAGEEKCPICQDTGIQECLDPYIPGSLKSVCSCSHGRDFLVSTREHPEQCPICHGTGKYSLFEEEKEGLYGPSERDCPHIRG